jgi:hypothetical protein
MMLWTTCQSRCTIHYGLGGMVVMLLVGDRHVTAMRLGCSPHSCMESRLGRSTPMTKDGGMLQIQASSGGEG